MHLKVFIFCAHITIVDIILGTICIETQITFRTLFLMLPKNFLPICHPHLISTLRSKNTASCFPQKISVFLGLMVAKMYVRSDATNPTFKMNWTNRGFQPLFSPNYNGNEIVKEIASPFCTAISLYNVIY